MNRSELKKDKEQSYSVLEGRVDTPKKNNRSQKEVSESILREIENYGLTIERLDELELPVYRYFTQITLHGKFPKLYVNYLGNYKNLFQNKNGSIGVKWQAVDFDKKRRIYNLLAKVDGWKIMKDSQTYSLSHIERIQESENENEQECLERKKKRFESIISNVDQSLIYGGASVNLLYHPFIGKWLELSLTINAIYESNIDPFLQQLTGKDYNTLNAEYEDIKRKEKQERDKDLAEFEKKRAREKEIKAQASKELEDKGYPYRQRSQAQGYYINPDCFGDELTYTVSKVYLPPNGKKLRESTTHANSLSEALEKIESGKVGISGDKIERISGHFVKRLQPESDKTSNKISSSKDAGGIKLVDYSKKAIVVTGNTKPLKDKLKAMKGKFNPKLSCGAGWVFPKERESEIRQELQV